MEALDVDVSRGFGRPLGGSGEYTVAGVSGTAEESEEEDIDVDIEAAVDPEVEKDTVVEEKLPLRGIRSLEDERLKGGLGGWYRRCDGGLDACWKLVADFGLGV